MRAFSALLAIVIAIAGVGYYYTAVDPIKNHMQLGLDLRGGAHMVYEAVPSELGDVTPEAIDAAMKVIERRVNSIGVSEPVIQKDSKNRIMVQIAGVMDLEQAREMVGKTAVLTFEDPDGKVVLDGKDIKEAGVQQQQGQADFVVTLKMKGEGTQKFADATTKWVGQQIAIKLDDMTISDPKVNTPIMNGEAIIEGGFTAESAKQLADLINGGALPVKLEMRENRIVTATLGADSLAKSAKAGLIGMAFVVVFMIILFRVPGIMADIALTVYAMLTLGFLLAINAVFTLPGIAGLLLSIGMAVDANVIIFSRIREELASGKGLRSGIDSGFNRAFSAVIDSNVTTLIAGVILWLFGTSSVKGFALTLSVGVFISLFTAITLTRWLINLCVRTGWFGKNLFGIKEVSR